MDEYEEFDFHGSQYQTWVTSKPLVLARWIFNLLVSHEFLSPDGFNLMLQGRFVLNNNTLDRFVYVVFDLLWPINAPLNASGIPTPATISLGSSNNCIIFQLQHAPEGLPVFLKAFLTTFPFVRFVGIQMLNKHRCFQHVYNLEIPSRFDLRDWAQYRYNMTFSEARAMKLEDLILRAFNVNYEKPQDIVESNWADKELDYGQIRYAAFDCFWMFKLIRYFTRNTWWATLSVA